MSPFLFFVSLFWTLAFGKAATEWCYEGPDCGPATWGGECQTGTKQSPIDLSFNTSVQPRSAHLYQSYAYFNSQDFFAVYNGHTVEVSLSRDLTSTATIDGPVFPRTESYVFAQLHFHWGSFNGQGSEHKVNDKPFPVEAHLVHYREDFDSLRAAISSNESDAVVVMGILFNFTASDVKNEALIPVIDAFSNVKRAAGENATGTDLKLSRFYPQKGEDLLAVQYEGSLTTPNCSQVFLWTVFIKPAPISQMQRLEAVGIDVLRLH